MAKTPTAQTYADPMNLNIKNILLLDDDDELTELLKQLLESRNFLVTVVRNGVEGLREIMNMDYDIILCDMMMPRMPGDMFYVAVERTKPHLCERFIFVTAHRGNPKVDEFVRKVSGNVLPKPFQINELIHIISSVLQTARPLSA